MKDSPGREKKNYLTLHLALKLLSMVDLCQTAFEEERRFTQRCNLASKR